MSNFKMSAGALLHYAEISRLSSLMEPQETYYNMGYTTESCLNEKGVQAFLLKSKDVTEMYVIAIRATDESRDFYRDAAFFQYETAYGKMHMGFYNGAKIISNWCKDYFRENKKYSMRLYVGHSLGGALAFASHVGFDRRSYAAVTFGAPRVVDSKFYLQSNFNHTRVRNCNDIVTRVPFRSFNYSHHGDLVYLDFNGNMKSKIGIFDGMKARFRAWKKKQIFDGFYDHSIEQYSKKLSKNIK